MTELAHVRFVPRRPFSYFLAQDTDRMSNDNDGSATVDSSEDETSDEDESTDVEKRKRRNGIQKRKLMPKNLHDPVSASEKLLLPLVFGDPCKLLHCE